MKEDWTECCFEDLLDYEQPTKYIVNSTKYNDSYKMPVLTAGKSFIKGYTNETDGIFDDLPTIIFDDFTTATQYVNFKFKVKSSAMKILVPTSKLVNMPLAYYAMQVNQVRSDTHKRYWISVFAKKKFLLPPLIEQTAIVKKIEELFSSLDSGIADLKKAQDQLAIYRQAVLKKAFEGKYELVKLEKISDAVGGNAFKSKTFIKDKGKYQVIRIGNVRPGIIRYDASPVYLNQVEKKVLEKYLLERGDVIITLTGTRKKRDYGFTAIVKTENLLLNQRLALLRFNDDYLPQFFLYFSWSEPFKIQFFGSETGNVGQGNVGMKSVRKTLIPKLSKHEQHQIVQEIESRLSVCDKVEENIAESLEKAKALRQSILKKAFNGALLNKEEIAKCKQDKDYEPASVLLEKIRAEKKQK
jgi:type I restriction enzyme S subunit